MNTFQVILSFHEWKSIWKVWYLDASPKSSSAGSKDNRLLSPNLRKGSTPPPQKSPSTDPRRNHQANSNEPESSPMSTKPVYNNYPVLNQKNKQDISTKDEGDIIENDLLDIVNTELQKDRLRNTSNNQNSEDSLQSLGQDDSLDIPTEPVTRLVHLGMKYKYKLPISNRKNLY